MNSGLVTVVLPVYNTDKYLDQCVSSIVSQTYSNLEILLIDDGSPDRCPEICDGWAAKDSRIRVIHKQNQGLGMARNTGIENARGEYICFFDSDDYVVPETIEKAYGRITETKAEVVSFGFSSVNEKGKLLSVFAPDMEQTVFRGEQVRQLFLPELIAPNPEGNGKQRLFMSAWSMLYSMEMIRKAGWRFVSERKIISEDVYSLMDLFQHVSHAAVLSEALYVYRSNAASLSRGYRPGRYEKIRHFYLECLGLCDRASYGKEIRDRLAAVYLAFTRAAMKQTMAAPEPLMKRIREIRRVLADETMSCVLQSLGTDRSSAVRWLLFFAMKHRMTGLCCVLLTVRNLADRRKG